jgi:hypothetical protein
MKNQFTSIIIGLSIVISVAIISHAYKNRNQKQERISVTGLGTKDFKSDLIVWSGSFSKRANELNNAYNRLDQDKQAIRNYLITKGVSASEIVFKAVDINKNFDYVYEKNGQSRRVFSGYSLSQRVEIESKEIEKIEQISRDITELITNGIEFYSNAPQYYYTQLADLKVEMIAAATDDATRRAEQIAKNANADLGGLKSAKMGIFQIIGQNSNEDYSWGGTFNTSSKEKTATITMKLEFGIDR